MARQVVAATSSVGWSLKEHPEYEGKIHVIEPLSIEKDVKTDYGSADATRANVYVLLGVNKVAEHEDALVFPKVVQSQLRKEIGTGNVVVGRLFKDVENQKKGQDPAWKLSKPNAADLQKASDFLASQTVRGAQDEPEDDGRPATSQPDEEEAF